MKRSGLLLFVCVAACWAQVPAGFTPLFDGKDLAGWHISTSTSHGTSQAWKAENGMITGTQDKPGNGSILLTDRKYRNFEVYLEMKPDWGCDSGLFLRSTEKGQAYQVTLDYLPTGYLGGIYGEALKGVDGFMPEGWEKHWKKGQWNTIRARIEGDVPHIIVWMNGDKITDWTDKANHAVGGATDGMIAVQVHGDGRCKPGLYHRFRNIAVKELK
jgi:hypothetical protein